jgi:hypothetical protein
MIEESFEAVILVVSNEQHQNGREKELDESYRARRRWEKRREGQIWSN